MIDITSVYNALSGFVGEYWAGFIVTAVVAVCALAQTAMSPPTENIRFHGKCRTFYSQYVPKQLVILG